MTNWLGPLLLLAVVAGCGRDCERLHPDEDGDGYGGVGTAAVEVCGDEDRAGLAPNALDCDDASAEVSPGADEVCDAAGADEDCDGLANDNDDSRVDGAQTWPDADHDGHGDTSAAAEVYCEIPDGRVAVGDDCDDADAKTHVGAAELDDPNACMEDADEDGFGALAPANPSAQPGADCDDGLASVRPRATERFGDQVDQDCDGADTWYLFDDFEAGSPKGAVWASRSGDVAVVDSVIVGLKALHLGSDGIVVMSTVDTAACGSMTWSYWAQEHDTTPADALVLQYQIGQDWYELSRWVGNATDDPTTSPVLRSGVVTDPAAYGATFALRLVVEAGLGSTGSFEIDDFRFACPGPDGDGDGVGTLYDCADGDAAHWADCGACTDGDGDGRGIGCDLGGDCDDEDASAFPGNADPDRDGVDQDCNGYDGPSLRDTFEAAVIDPLTWEQVEGYRLPSRAHQGARSLLLEGDASAVSWPIDASSCAQVSWSYWLMRGPAEADDSLVLSWDDGSGQWVDVDVVNGTGAADDAFARRHGVISDPAAMASGFRIRLETDGEGGPELDQFYVDDLVVACTGPDGDLDGFPVDWDCDDADPARWDDCDP